ncbi:hypothetical protein F2Q69_00002611 [Brassica cretica]|uniref:RNase H type-1 domain-containing protein n=1 Tax=Brassica cretica TaxID=69181 RepID=A0A8S9P519_BRACR|nr:hypothetical protein F2Q69_00002611 [Brassica cretica]
MIPTNVTNKYFQQTSPANTPFLGQTFDFSLAALRDVLSSPDSYPQYLCLFEDLQSLLNRMDSWCLCLVSPTENRASERIARSVTRDNRSQSYVAQNSPLWLTTILEADAMCTL